MKWIICVICIIFTFLSAQDSEPKPQGDKAILEKLDSDKDGKISKDEWKGNPEIFNRLDVDKDGYLTPEELPKRPKGPKDAKSFKGAKGFQEHQGPHPILMWLKRIDKNNDRKISQQEWKDEFKSLDKNGDGYLAMDELMQMGKQGSQDPQSMKKAFFSRMDTNGDGKIDKQEWKGPKQAFDKLDKDQDGFISKEELEAAPKLRPQKERPERRRPQKEEPQEEEQEEQGENS